MFSLRVTLELARVRMDGGEARLNIGKWIDGSDTVRKKFGGFLSVDEAKALYNALRGLFEAEADDDN